MTKTSCSVSTLGCSRYSTKTFVVPRGSEGSSLDNSSAQVFSFWRIYLTIILPKSFHICSTILWYLASRESLTSNSPRTCRVICCESMKIITLSTRIFLVNLKPDSRPSYSITLLVTGNLNLMDYLNSFLPGSTKRILAPNVISTVSEGVPFFFRYWYVPVPVCFGVLF